MTETPGEEPIYGDPAPDPDDWITDYETWSEGIDPNMDEVSVDGGDEPPVNEGGSEAYWETYQTQPLPSCRNYTKNGSVGKIVIAGNPAIVGNVQWTAFMNQWWENCGLWLWRTSRNGTQLDNNFNNPAKQWYPPHGSYSSPQTNPGNVFTVEVFHAYFNWRAFCGWEFQVKSAHGSASCIVP